MLYVRPALSIGFFKVYSTRVMLSFLIFNATIPFSQRILKITISKTGNQLECQQSGMAEFVV